MNRGIIVVCAVALALFLTCSCANEKDFYVPPVSVETQIVADAVEGFPYSFQLAADGGAGDSYEWILISGAFPQGTTLLASGVISGTPLLVGQHTFTVNVRETTMPFITDNDTKEFTLAVKAWQRPVDITTGGSDSRNPSVVVDGSGVVHGAWEEGTAGSTDIYYSADLGTTAAASANVSNTVENSAHPFIAVDGNDTVHLVWAEYSGTTCNVAYASNDGTGWTAASDISASTVNSTAPVIAVDSADNVHVVWVESSAGGDEILWSCYNGSSWTASQCISGSVSDCGAPAIWADTTVYVTFVGGTGASSEIYYASRSGSSWSTPVNVSNDAVESTQPAVLSGASVLLAWSYDAATSRQIAYRVFSDDEWGDVGFIDETGGSAQNLTVTVDGQGRATLVWEDGAAPKSIYMVQVASGTAGLPICISDPAVDTVEPAVGIDASGRVYGLYSYDDSADYQIGYTEFALHVWRETEEIPASGTNPRKVRIAVDAQKTIHCIWQQIDGPGHVNIYYSSIEPRYSWTTPLLISTTNPSTGSVDHAHIDVDREDDIHVVWGGPDSTGTSQIWYTNLRSSTWLVPVRLTSGTTDISYWPDVAVNSQGEVHVVFVKYINAYGHQEIFHTFTADGLLWSAPANISSSSTSESWGPSMAIGNNDSLHVTWTDGNDIAYRSFDGAVWSTIVNLSSNPGISQMSDIAIGENGTVLVAWQDSMSGTYRPMFSIYNGTTWSIAADINSSLPSQAELLNLTCSEGTFYAAWVQSVPLMNRNIWLSSYDGTSWSTPVDLSNNSGVEWLGSIGGGVTSDNTGTIHVVYNESTAGKLWYTRK